MSPANIRTALTMIAVVVLAASLVGCTSSAPPAADIAPVAPAAPAVTTPTLSATDQAYLTELQSKLASEPGGSQSFLYPLVGDEEWISLAKSFCTNATNGQYDAAVGQQVVVSGKVANHTVLNVDPFENFIPAALDTYCPTVATAFNTWANTSSGTSTPAPVAPADTATFAVTSPSGRASSISYDTVSAGGAGQQQANDAALPWSYSENLGSGSNPVLSLVAQNASGASGASITCSISVNGNVISTNTSTGPYAVVSCSG